VFNVTTINYPLQWEDWSKSRKSGTKWVESDEKKGLARSASAEKPADEWALEWAEAKQWAVSTLAEKGATSLADD